MKEERLERVRMLRRLLQQHRKWHCCLRGEEWTGTKEWTHFTDVREIAFLR